MGPSQRIWPIIIWANSMLTIFLKTILIFAVSVLGGILHRYRKLNIKTISDIILYLAAPALVFVTISQSRYSLQDMAEYGFFFSLLILGMFPIVSFIYKKKVKKKPILFIGSMFMNTANLGFPITLLFFGQQALGIAIVFDLTMVFWLFSLGVILLDKKAGVYACLKLPVLYAGALAMLFKAVSLEMPTMLLDILVIMGQMTVPLMLVSLGARLSEIKLQELKLALPFQIAMLRGIGGLLLGLLIMSIWQQEEIMRNVFLLYAILPAPMMTYVLAQEYQQDEVLAAEIVLISTISSLFYIPLFLGIIS